MIKRTSTIFFPLLIVSGSLITGCQQIKQSTLESEKAHAQPAARIEKSSSASKGFFTEVTDVFPREEQNRKKWGNPAISDLDHDGYPDLLLNDHGFSLKVYWNNAGKFSKGYDLIMGDLHGVSTGDYNQDGDTDILVARGGGSGSNARNTKIFHVDKKRKFTTGDDFNKPLKNLRGRTNKFIDGDNDGDLDLILMGFPSGKSKGSENNIYKNNGNGDLSFSSYLPKTRVNGQKVLVTDFNNDHIVDLMIYGEGVLKAYEGDGKLGYTDVTKKVFAGDFRHVTGIAEIDYDNDGDFDIYITRGKDLLSGETFFDKDNGVLAFHSKRQKFELEDLVIGDVLNLVNYGTTYPHQDIYIGESGYSYEFTGEYQGGQDIKMISSNALGWPDVTDKKGLYIGYVGNDTWRMTVNTNPITTGLITGVNHYPEFEHEVGLSDVLLENVNGKFVDVTEKANVLFVEHTTGLAVGDYDNNGFQDIFIVKRGDLSTSNKQILFLNNGDGTFNEVNKHAIISPELGALGLGAESFDYNLDGRLDLIYGNERGLWHLFKNTLPLNKKTHFVSLSVGNSPSGKATEVGALVSLTACGKTQVRRLGSTSGPYTQGNDNLIHFGLGQCDQIESTSVRWTNGEVSSLSSVKANAIHKVGTF